MTISMTDLMTESMTDRASKQSCKLAQSMIPTWWGLCPYQVTITIYDYDDWSLLHSKVRITIDHDLKI